jgi:hypothetical protein
MLDELIRWVGGGLLFLLSYIVISNTLWLLLGSRLLQSLPGVNIRGVKGTVKIATLIVLGALGFFFWICQYLIGMFRKDRERPKLKKVIEVTIGKGYRAFKTLI